MEVILESGLPSKAVFRFPLCEKRANIGRGPSMDSFVDLCS